MVSRMNLMNKNFESGSWGKPFAVLKIDRLNSISCFYIFFVLSYSPVGEISVDTTFFPLILQLVFITLCKPQWNAKFYTTW